jgi:lipopolysaccharide/colanic/teichoic acid biosynthesis glycosyltransferase
VTERAEWDNYYIQNWSLWLDAKILAMTCWVALRGGGE